MRAAYVAVFLIVCGYLLYALRGVLTPIFVAFAIAYLLDPLVDRLEAVGAPRALGITVLLVLTLLVLTLFALLVVPAMVRDLSALAHELPSAVIGLFARLSDWLAARGIEVPHTADDALEAVQQHLRTMVPNAVALMRSSVTAVLGGTASALGAIAAVVIVPVLSFYLLRDFDRMMAAAVGMLPASMRARAVGTGREVDTVLGQFVRGQLIVMAILGALYAGGYALIGVRLAIPIGVIAGLLSFIPYVGSGVALGLALLMTALELGGPVQYLLVLAVYGVVQTLEGFVITPRIVGDKLGIPPVIVLIALMIGGELFGFLGVMLALPVSAVIKVFAGHALHRYQASGFYSGAATLERAPARLRLRRARVTRRRHKVPR